MTLDQLLPFPHPLTARKHPTMRLTFPPIPPSIQSPPLTSSNNANALSRVSSRRDKLSGEENQPILTAESSDPAGLGKSRIVSFSRQASSAGSSSPEKISRQPTQSSLPVSEEDEPMEMTTSPREELMEDELEIEDEDEYEEEEEEEDDDGEDLQPSSQYISALDLAGFG